MVNSLEYPWGKRQAVYSLWNTKGQVKEEREGKISAGAAILSLWALIPICAPPDLAGSSPAEPDLFLLQVCAYLGGASSH